jgi:hypothetical protein
LTIVRDRLVDPGPGGIGVEGEGRLVVVEGPLARINDGSASLNLAAAYKASPSWANITTDVSLGSAPATGSSCTSPRTLAPRHPTSSSRPSIEISPSTWGISVAKPETTATAREATVVTSDRPAVRDI